MEPKFVRPLGVVEGRMSIGRSACNLNAGGALVRHLAALRFSVNCDVTHSGRRAR
jgi:hypothetical protein